MLIIDESSKGKQEHSRNITSRINWDVDWEILVMILFEKLLRTSRDLLENKDIY